MGGCKGELQPRSLPRTPVQRKKDWRCASLLMNYLESYMGLENKISPPRDAPRRSRVPAPQIKKRDSLSPFKSKRTPISPPLSPFSCISLSFVGFGVGGRGRVLRGFAYNPILLIFVFLWNFL